MNILTFDDPTHPDGRLERTPRPGGVEPAHRQFKSNTHSYESVSQKCLLLPLLVVGRV